MTRWFNHNVLQFTSPSWHHSRFRTKKTSSSLKHRHVKHYRLLYAVAHGSTCIVYLALDTKTRKLCAIKEMDGAKLQRQLCMDWLQSRNPKNQQQQHERSDNYKRRRIDSPSTPTTISCMESELLQHLHHDNIIEWLDCFEEDNNLYLVTEWIDGSVLINLHNDDDDDNLSDDIKQHISPLDSSTCHSVFTQLVDILDYLHQKNVIHCDIKPDNILITEDNRIKLIDFGSAIKLDSGNSCNGQSHDGEISNTIKVPRYAQRRRTPAFTPPECIKKDNHMNDTMSRKRYETAGDIWCLGLTLYCMIYGKLPYHQQQDQTLPANYMDLYHLLSESTLPTIPHEDTTDPLLCHLIDQMLTISPVERITLDQIRSHPWFVGPCITPSLKPHVE